MRFLAWLAASLLLSLLVVFCLLVAALEPAPLVTRGETISPASIAQAKLLLARNDPRRLARGVQCGRDDP